MAQLPPSGPGPQARCAAVADRVRVSRGMTRLVTPWENYTMLTAWVVADYRSTCAQSESAALRELA